ncbi:hypothetical protein QBC43DRAFT_48523 [Cladorrhinum sp. PSN259]|nr:hypothetical protein QBC43DRAFT_48523 [Cladorrhinum sp. PSN259]
MCIQHDYVFACNHRAFARFDNCPNFGRTCYGAGGTHNELLVKDICSDCKTRPFDPNPLGRLNDPYLAAKRKAIEGGGGGGGKK